MSAMSGWLAVGVVGGILLGALIGLVVHAGPLPFWSELTRPSTLAIIRFTLWQASLSAGLSLLFALPMARALHRRPHFFGRTTLLKLTSLALVVPSMVAVPGLIAIHGYNGWLNDARHLVGLPRLTYLYGLPGILLAHIFFNCPLATRLIYHALGPIPAYQWHLASQLNLRGVHLFRHLEWPAIKAVLPSTFGLIFLLCFTSFAVILTLGGSPANTTLEVLIYQAVRFDFDLARAVALSLIQLALCLGLSLCFFARPNIPFMQAEHYPTAHRPDRHRARVSDTLWLAGGALFLATPLLAVFIRSFTRDGWSIVAHPAFWRALQTSIGIALAAGLLATGLAIGIAQLLADLRATPRPAHARLRLTHRLTHHFRAIPEIIGMLTLLLPPITLGTGLFLLTRYFNLPNSGPVLIIIVNALLAMAFCQRILVPAVATQQTRFHPLCVSLGIVGLNRWRHVLWRPLRRPIGYAVAVATTLSLGDFGVIALFGTEQLTTLPLLIYRLLGSYRLEQAAVVAACLCLLCLLLFILLERGANKPC